MYQGGDRNADPRCWHSRNWTSTVKGPRHTVRARDRDAPESGQPPVSPMRTLQHHDADRADNDPQSAGDCEALIQQDSDRQGKDGGKDSPNDSSEWVTIGKRLPRQGSNL
jgi:hypothetical protein